MKKGLYEVLGVRKYVIFDPLREDVEPQVKAYRLKQAEYVPLVGDPIHSETLGLDLKIIDGRLIDGRLRIYDPAAGRLLPTREESELRADQEAAAHQASEAARPSAEAALERERAAREALEAEVQHLRAERGLPPGA